MRRLITICALAVLILAVGSAQADMTVIDFEDLAAWTIVDDQYLGLGADFNGDATIGVQGVNLSSIYPPHSGTTVAVDNPGGDGTIRVDSVGLEWLMAGGYVTGMLDVTLTAYDSGGNILGTDNTGGANYIGAGTGLPPNIFLSVSGANIAYVEFTDGGNTYTLDDFSFEPVPVPAAVLLGILGLSVAGVKLRKFA